ncbi:TadE/TadG family type IV pilus assembly protein [Acidicapsa ligni]|uniref:TadE/TadG family type IV pilus assembly protein n=1 Tax=Acidicapsa ligni TaxID=542300 RepID=UPI0021DFD79D|nr:TadE/TadG family type IV pilus assembly protein [Acidicapsa ligni]
MKYPASSIQQKSTWDHKSHARSIRKDERGSSLLEFTLTISIVLVTVFSIMGFSLLLYADHFVASAANDAVRYAIVRGSTWDAASIATGGKAVPCATPTTASCTATVANIQSFVVSIIPPGITAGNVIATPAWTGASPTGAACDTFNSGSSTDGSNNPGCTVTVTVNYSFSSIFVFLPLIPKTFSLSYKASAAIVM